MFPTIFAISLKGLGGKTKRASSFLMMSPVGGAVGPVLMLSLIHISGMGSGLLFFMLALPAPAAVAAALAGMGLRLRAGGRVCRFRLQEGKGQVDIQVDGHKIVSGSHRRFLLNFL